jgi:hypothetical protein
MNKYLLTTLIGLALLLTACGQPSAARPASVPAGGAPSPQVTGIKLKGTPLPTTGPAATPRDTPTPDPTRVVDDAGTELYIVQNGD